MKKSKKKLITLLTLAVFLFIASSNLFALTKSYAYDKGTQIYYLAASKPRSGGFSSGGFKSYSKPKTTIIKPDSGSFSTKPNTSYSNKNSGSSIKPDSGSFSTKPKTDNKTYNEKNKEYDNYPKTSKSIFGRGFYGFFNPFYRMRYGFGTSSWIIKAVMVITIIVILYIVIDFIRSRRK